MFCCPHIGKLGNAGAGDLMNRLTRGIGHKVYVQCRVGHAEKLGCPAGPVTGFQTFLPDGPIEAVGWGFHVRRMPVPGTRYRLLPAPVRIMP